MTGTIITRDELLSAWRSQPRLTPVRIMVVSAEMEDSSKTPWRQYDLCSEYLDPALLRHYKIAKADATPGCKGYSLGIFQQTHTFAADDFREGGSLAWWGLTGYHETAKDEARNPLASQPFPEQIRNRYLLMQMLQYDAEMSGRWVRARRRIHATQNPLEQNLALRDMFASYNGSGDRALAYGDKAFNYLLRVRKELPD